LVGNRDSRNDRDGFRGLWRRLKPADKPDEVSCFLLTLFFVSPYTRLPFNQGVPFDIDDAMFNPPMPRPTSEYSLEPHIYPNQPYQRHSALVLDHEEVPPGAKRNRSLRSRNRIIPPEEDMRRLFQECTIGQGNANLLSDALAFSSGTEDSEREIIRVRPLLSDITTD